MIRIFVLAALILVVPAVARAATIDFLGMGNAEIVAIGGVRTITAWAGEIKWAWLTGNPTGSSDPFYTYCVDLLTDEKDGQTVTLKSTADLPEHGHEWRGEGGLAVQHLRRHRPRGDG